MSQQVFDQMRSDKSDDGILQRNMVGEKKRGALDVDYGVPVLGGNILRW